MKGFTIISFALAYMAISVAMQTTGTSDITGWNCTLSTEIMPIISTKEELLELSLTYNGTVRIDRVAGINMVIEHRTATQVATLSGSLDALASSVLSSINVSLQTLDSYVKLADEQIAALDNGTYNYDPFRKSATGAFKPDTGLSLPPRVAEDKTATDSKIAGPTFEACGVCLILISCNYGDTDGCKSICVGLVCIMV
ncbi:hypothetical protein LTR62_000573 [Meristemomyces frigidus]|uniref:Uncharacterized protein n=1 Tax=Meristemomyces frigidus TaxID=1508187 RepID=A0AAN7THN0_9PEZI|nr:hypothetical protein LTR62_000573 [Meristemomyces frigidus]